MRLTIELLFDFETALEFVLINDDSIVEFRDALDRAKKLPLFRFTGDSKKLGLKILARLFFPFVELVSFILIVLVPKSSPGF